MVFQYVRNEKEERERLEKKYNLKNPYVDTPVSFRYCSYNEDKTYCLVGVARGRGREEKQPDVFAFITPNGIAYLSGYKENVPGEAHWEIIDVSTKEVNCENREDLYELMKQALIAYTETEYVKAMIDFFPHE